MSPLIGGIRVWHGAATEPNGAVITAGTGREGEGGGGGASCQHLTSDGSSHAGVHAALFLGPRHEAGTLIQDPTSPQS